jgi:hypothetical protein
MDSEALLIRWIVVFLCGALTASFASSAAEKEHWHSVKGVSLQTLFQDKEFGDGVHFAYRFKSGGTFSGTEMGRDVNGTWRVTKNEMCWKWKRPPGPEECYRVQQDGVRVRLMANDSEAFFGTLGRAP